MDAAVPSPAPSMQRRRRSAMPMPVLLLVAINVVVFLLWQAGRFSPALLQVMADNFMVSAAHLRAGHVWTLLTAAFSHIDLWHLLFNMVVVWSFGSPLARILGGRVFVTFFLAAAVFSSASHCVVSGLIGRGEVPALGASGAASALLLVFALLFPRHRILIFGIVPLPALVGVLAFIAFDLWGLVAQSSGGGLPIGHGAHLGGSLAGLIMYLGYVRPRLPTMRTSPQAEPSATAVHLTIEEAAEFERIRAKLNHSGPDSLNPREQDFMRRLRERVVNDE